MEDEPHFAAGLEPPSERSAEPLPSSAGSTTPPPPPFADGSERKLERGWIGASRIGGLLFFGVLSAVAYFALFTTFIAGDFTLVTFGLAVGTLTTVVAIVLVLAALWPKWEHARAGYRIQPDRIEMWRGLVWRRHVSVPISRVQYTDVKQGPVQRSHGIATLVVHTAGTLSSDIEFPGLPPELAARVRDWLVAQTGSDAV